VEEKTGKQSPKGAGKDPIERFLFLKSGFISAEFDLALVGVNEEASSHCSNSLSSIYCRASRCYSNFDKNLPWLSYMVKQ